jgi:hypothetical protein
VGISVEEKRVIVVDGRETGDVLYAGCSGYKNNIRDEPH